MGKCPEGETFPLPDISPPKNVHLSPLTHCGFTKEQNTGNLKHPRGPKSPLYALSFGNVATYLQIMILWERRWLPHVLFKYGVVLSTQLWEFSVEISPLKTSRKIRWIINNLATLCPTVLNLMWWCIETFVVAELLKSTSGQIQGGA